MIDNLIEHVVGYAIAIIFSINIIDMMCIGFLEFSPVDAVKKLIAKLIDKKEKSDNED